MDETDNGDSIRTSRFSSVSMIRKGTDAEKFQWINDARLMVYSDCAIGLINHLVLSGKLWASSALKCGVVESAILRGKSCFKVT